MCRGWKAHRAWLYTPSTVEKVEVVEAFEMGRVYPVCDIMTMEEEA